MAKRGANPHSQAARRTSRQRSSELSDYRRLRLILSALGTGARGVRADSRRGVRPPEDLMLASVPSVTGQQTTSGWCVFFEMLKPLQDEGLKPTTGGEVQSEAPSARNLRLNPICIVP